MSNPDNYPDPYEWAVEFEERAERAEAKVKELEEKEALRKTMWEVKYAGTCKRMLDLYEIAINLLGRTFDAYKNTQPLSSKEIENVSVTLNNFSRIKKEVFKEEAGNE